MHAEGLTMHRLSVRLEEGMEAVIAEHTKLRCLLSAIQLAGAARQAGALRETRVTALPVRGGGFTLAGGRISGVGPAEVALIPYEPVGWLAIATFGSTRRRLGVGGTPAAALGNADATLVQEFHGKEDRVALLAEAAAPAQRPRIRVRTGTRGLASVVDVALFEFARRSNRIVDGDERAAGLVLDDTLALARHGRERRVRVQVLTRWSSHGGTSTVTVSCVPGATYTARDPDPVRALRDAVWFMDVFLGRFAFESAPPSVQSGAAKGAIFPIDPERGPWLGPVTEPSSGGVGNGQWVIEFVAPWGAKGRTAGPSASDALRWLLPELNRWVKHS